MISTTGSISAAELQKLRDEEVLGLVRETVGVLNGLAERLERYAEERTPEDISLYTPVGTGEIPIARDTEAQENGHLEPEAEA